MRRLSPWVLALLLVGTTSSAATTRKKPPAPAAATKKEPPRPPPVPTEPTEALVDAWGKKPMGLLQSASKFTVYTVNSTQAGLRPNPTLVVGADFERVATGKELTDANIKAFRGLLYDEKTYQLDHPPSCDFVPDLAVLANSGTDVLELLLSFRCNAVMFFTTKPGGRSIPGVQFDVKPGRKALLAFVKDLLPQEPKVRELK